MSDITILLLYLLGAAAFGCSRLPRFSHQTRPLVLAASILVTIGITLHCQSLYTHMLAANGLDLSLSNAASLIGLELALISVFAALEPTLRGISAGLLILGAFAASLTGLEAVPSSIAVLSWQLRLHIMVSLVSYGLLTVGAIVAIYALIQERRLRAGRLSSFNHLFAPLETTERLLFSIAAAGFAGLAIAIVSGLTFVENLFAQHLVHKTAFSLLALFVFGTLLAGRFFKGWRGARAIKLYLGGFLLLCLAYFGTRVILEQLLGRSWG